MLGFVLAAAWAVVADYPRDPEWRTGVLEMRLEPAGEVAEGSTTHEVLRLGGRTYRNDAVVTRAVRPRGSGGCEVILELHVVPHGMNRLLAPVLRRTLAKNLRADLERLAGIVRVEAEAAA